MATRMSMRRYSPLILLILCGAFFAASPVFAASARKAARALPAKKSSRPAPTPKSSLETVTPQEPFVLPDLSQAESPPPMAAKTSVVSSGTGNVTGEGADNAVGLQIVELMQYEVFLDLPKAHKTFPVVPAPFPSFVYGPYQMDVGPYAASPDKTELDSRILALGEAIAVAESHARDAAADTGSASGSGSAVAPKVTDPLLVVKKIHLADLKAIRSHGTQDPADFRDVVAAYAGVYQKAPPELSPYVSLNMANALLLVDDTVMALPIIKKLYRDFSGIKELKRPLDATLVELYFLAGRYEKAWSELEDLVRYKEVGSESPAYRLRVGDILFFMKRYREAAEWYQSVLKPSDTATLSENVSWLYLAEALFQRGNTDVATKIYAAMSPYFEGTVYGEVVRYRLDPSDATAEAVMRTTSSRVVKDWLHVERLSRQFAVNPAILASDSLDYVFGEKDYSDDLKQELLAMQAYAYAFEKNNYDAIKVYQSLELAQRSPVLLELIGQAVLGVIKKEANATQDEEQAYRFLKFMRQNDFRLRTAEPEDLFAMLRRNLDLMGMKDVAAEMTLHIIDKSVHRPKDRTLLDLRLARALFDARAPRTALKALEQVDVKLLDFPDKDDFYRMRLEGLLQTAQYKEALALIEGWETEGASAKNVYWAALKKVEIHNALQKPEDALKVVESAVGSGKVGFLPLEFSDVVDPLLAYQVILKNKTQKNFEALADFYANQERVLATEQATDALLAALSAALALNKKGDVVKIMSVAKTRVDDKTFAWLGRWTSGEMWVRQLDDYLNRRSAAVDEKEK